MTPTTPMKKSELSELLERIRDDPDAGPWREWARRMTEGNGGRSEGRREGESIGISTNEGR